MIVEPAKWEFQDYLLVIFASGIGFLATTFVYIATLDAVNQQSLSLLTGRILVIGFVLMYVGIVKLLAWCRCTYPDQWHQIITAVLLISYS